MVRRRRSRASCGAATALSLALAITTACSVDESAGARSEGDASSAGGSAGSDGAAAGKGGDASDDAAPDAPLADSEGADSPDGAAVIRVLAFSKTTGFRHASIPDAIAAIVGMEDARGFAVDTTEDGAVFTDTTLAGYDVVLFLLSSGDLLDASQEDALQRFVRSGKGWVGVHSASDTEYDWPWYGELVGAWFSSHPSIQPASVRVERPHQLGTLGLPEQWMRADEWYSFRDNPRARVQVLLSLDESSYGVGGSAMGDHPIAWHRGFEGGRSFYTALGHTSESWTEPAFLDHVGGGIEWAAGRTAPGVVLEEFDGAHENGTWDMHGYAGTFPYDVTEDALVMHDLDQGNQHLTRREIAMDPDRQYVVEALFVINGPSGLPINSFCLNLNVGGPDGDLALPNTWSINLDVADVPPAGVMKHMGFLDGAFRQIGEHSVTWGRKNVEYLLRVAVNTADDGSLAPDVVTVTVLEAGVARERFSVDYSAFPYQPDPASTVRIGANTHSTDWTMRGLRAYYLD